MNKYAGHASFDKQMRRIKGDVENECDKARQGEGAISHHANSKEQERKKEIEELVN